MSTLAGETPSKIVKSEDDLIHYFDDYVKTPDGLLLGLEAEFLAVDSETGKALPYDGEFGIEAILRELSKRYHYQPILDSGHIIALQKKECVIALEPGGQIELSASPVSNVFEIESQIQTFLAELKAVQEQIGNIRYLAVGIHPFSGLDEVSWVPKTRYDIMRKHLGERGARSHDMMKRTATNQLNVDYLNEEDAMAKLQTVLGLSSIVTAMFANSSFALGKPSGYMTERLDIWNGTDPDRSGLLLEFIHPGKTFRDYLSYILNMPMIFIVRDGKWIPLKGKPFKQFIKDGFEGKAATLGDFELHLSTAFPEARIKQFLEIRGVDAQEPALIPSVAAFWKGILYDEETRKNAWNLVKDATDDERRALHFAVPKEGLKAQLGKKPILPIAQELVDLSCQSLAKQTSEKESRDECIFLERIREKITRPGQSPARTLINKWSQDWNQDRSKLLEYLSLS